MKQKTNKQIEYYLSYFIFIYQQISYSKTKKQTIFTQDKVSNTIDQSSLINQKISLITLLHKFYCHFLKIKKKSMSLHMQLKSCKINNQINAKSQKGEFNQQINTIKIINEIKIQYANQVLQFEINYNIKNNTIENKRINCFYFRFRVKFYIFLHQAKALLKLFVPYKPIQFLLFFKNSKKLSKQRNYKKKNEKVRNQKSINILYFKKVSQIKKLMQKINKSNKKLINKLILKLEKQTYFTKERLSDLKDCCRLLKQNLKLMHLVYQFDFYCLNISHNKISIIEKISKKNNQLNFNLINRVLMNDYIKNQKDQIQINYFYFRLSVKYESLL
ncbi:hypothetical protein TTHERM_001568160 (macronuclear) [Tetrahymena thermophila SB210]|uniref:Uncharacterized protein n=1 Tax=Tetrahymena thermophila (strain SB210) TaxID=312017 RepID=W7X437_TETTS|nr:hypothetical protein TTHERM_001568160 [Tetrahymena thermophila SB210]EWS72197.1 hypothetical protein TTHERM_001568160 [Tetrahymena thermophila SB210]|eukprot:XP_012655269.1 hypothetical protein TTHERM_001568160 [Tetrahymena thermophila SB210]